MLHRRRTDLPITALHILFPGGRIAETPGTAGITNLLLKTSQKGTVSYSAEELAARIERLGTSIGTTLAADYLGFSMKLLSDRAGEGFALLKEVIRNPAFPTEAVDREKQAIYAEIRRQKDSMFSRSLDLFNRARFGEHPYGLPASGEEAAVAAITGSEVRGWHERWFRSGGAIIGVVGSISADEAIDLLGDAIPTGERTRHELDGRIPDGTDELTESVEKQQTASVMGFEGATMDSPDRHALDLLAEITSGLAGRFFRAVRGDNALAYAVTSFHRPRREAGIFGTYTATSPDKEVTAREILLAECARLASERVSEDELRDAKEAIRGEYVIHNQTFGAQAGELAVNHLYGLPLDEPERYLERVDSVTGEELMAAAARYLTPDRYWLGVVRGTAAP
jgi:predicted Zn-dependent peptidase